MSVSKLLESAESFGFKGCGLIRPGVLDRIHHALYVACREKAEREATPTAAIIDSQSVKSAEKGGPASIRMAMMRAKK